MQASTIVATLSLVLAAALAAGHAFSQDAPPPSESKAMTIQKKVDEREAQRRAAVEENRKRKEEFAKRCTKPVKTQSELEECRKVYRQI
jgi:hypothetical protein